MKPKRARADSQKKRTEIIRRATKLFLQKGFDATSTNDICAYAKLTKPSLYHYFESKNHLLFSVHMRTIETVLYPFLEEVMLIKEPDKRLETMVREFTRTICSHPELRFLLHGTLGIRDKHHAAIRKEWKKFYLLLRDTISELQSAGKADRDVSPSWAALLLLGMVAWITFWFDYKRRDQIDEIARLTVKMAFRGLGSEPGLPGSASPPSEERDMKSQEVRKQKNNKKY